MTGTLTELKCTTHTTQVENRGKQKKITHERGKKVLKKANRKSLDNETKGQTIQIKKK